MKNCQLIILVILHYSLLIERSAEEVIFSLVFLAYTFLFLSRVKMIKVIYWGQKKVTFINQNVFLK